MGAGNRSCHRRSHSVRCRDPETAQRRRIAASHLKIQGPAGLAFPPSARGQPHLVASDRRTLNFVLVSSQPGNFCRQSQDEGHRTLLGLPAQLRPGLYRVKLP